MKSLVLIPALLTTSLVAGQASALEFGGANFEITYTATEDFASSQELIAGSAEISFGGPIGLQLDVVNTSYEGFADSGAFGFGGHIVYEVSPTVVLGAYFFTEDWTGDTWNSYGVEGIFETGKITYEIAVGAYQEAGDTAYFNFNAIATYHASDRFDVIAGALVSYWGDFGDAADIYNDFNIGARFTFDSGLYVSGAYNILAYDGSSDGSVSLGLGFDFGGGVTFSRRAYASLYPGD